MGTRLTVTLDDDVTQLVEKEARTKGKSKSQVVNEHTRDSYESNPERGTYLAAIGESMLVAGAVYGLLANPLAGVLLLLGGVCVMLWGVLRPYLETGHGIIQSLKLAFGVL